MNLPHSLFSTCPTVDGDRTRWRRVSDASLVELGPLAVVKSLSQSLPYLSTNNEYWQYLALLFSEGSLHLSETR